LDDAIRLWVKEEPGLYDIDSNKMIGKAGSMFGKGKGFWFDTAWWLHPSILSLNYITIYLSKKLFYQKKSSILNLFSELTSHFDAIYGYVSEEMAQERQHTTGTLIERIPGIFWLNFYSPIFVNYLNTGFLLLDFPWEKTKVFGDGSVLPQLTKSPYDEIIADL
jgi:hypothetical protein